MNKQFALRLRRAIQAVGINPTQFAYKARVPQGTISKCLSGHVPTARILLRIAKLTGKSVDWFLTGKEAKGRGEGYIAERPARYGTKRLKTSDEAWVEKLLKVLRSGNRRKKQTIKELLDVLSR